MATKSWSANWMDASLNAIRDKSDTLILCSAEPLTFTEANVTYKLAEVALTGVSFSIADGNVSGRKITLLPQSILVTLTGTLTHAVLVSKATLSLVYVFISLSTMLVSTSTITTAPYSIELRDPF